MPGGGLRVSDCEDILIQGNEINDCSRRSSGGTHGLVVTKATSTRLTDDYRIKIIANKVHHNYNEQYSWAPDKIEIVPHIDEGKGISLQRNQTVSGANPVNWENGRILIANNICYYNGFSGIHSNDGNRIDVINNTCYFNSYTGSITNYTGVINPNGGNIGISISDGTGNKIINNIVVIDNNMTKAAISTNVTATGALYVKDNIIYGTTGTIGTNLLIDAIQINTQMVSPQFVNQSSYNFTLMSSSTAINNADPSYAAVTPELTTDYYGNTRTTPDIGAIEFLSVLPIDLLNFNAKLVQEKVVIKWQVANEKTLSHYIVERSDDGKLFYFLQRQEAGRFSAIDDKPNYGTNYYRLKMVENDGSYNYSTIRSVQFEPKNVQNLMFIPIQRMMF
jgi:hypothetical protein